MMIEEILPAQTKSNTLYLARTDRDHALRELKSSPTPFRHLDISMLTCEVDADLVEHMLGACNKVQVGVSLRLAHNDLGSGTDCEQRIFECKAERAMRESEEKFHQKKKKDSASQKDFTTSAQMRKTAEEGINIVVGHLEKIDAQLRELEERKLDTAWYKLFSQMESQNVNQIRSLDLSNCGLHATGMALLTHVMLELEQRAEGARITELALDGNDLADIGMASFATLLRLTSCLEILRLRNVGATEEGISQILSGLVSNKTVALVDLRNNGLCSGEVVKAAVDGIRRFNKQVEILID